ncbi:MAG: aminotransferase class I/II-fold pyridoxal phosphate-dependent enzyme, partial [Thermoplasmata archaeon]|nr:aminotransferase class I/II-fold pyridoxal phosphate-dependent enzyme [Thermoplasmata archaeon]
ELIEAVKRAVDHGGNQYSITWGDPGLRAAISRKAREFNGIESDPETNLVVTCGATEAMMASMLSLIDPGDEAIIFEPFYENYGPDARVSGATPRHVRLEWPDWHFGEEALKAAFNAKTKVLILNTPNNPTGKVFSRAELTLLADLCTDHDVVAVTDEIYDHMVYDEGRHISLATIGSMAERTVTINGLSKTYSATGWRVGWAIAPPTLATAIRRAHDFLTVCAPHAFQLAGVAALALPPGYYDELRRTYQAKRDRLVTALRGAGIDCRPPGGTYYVMTDFSAFPFEDDWAFAMHLIQTCGIATVPGSSFYADPRAGGKQVRFVFCKREATLDDAVGRLARLNPGASRATQAGSPP